MRARWFAAMLAVVVGLALSGLASELQPTNIEIILDASASMTATVAGGVKFDVARQAIGQLLQVLPTTYNVGLRVYGHRYPSEDTVRSCQDTELLVRLTPLTPDSRSAINQRLATLQAKGMTPIAYVLEQAANDFATATGKNIIILVSDGEETCGGDPLSRADWIAGLGIGLEVYVVGFDVTSYQQLKGIAERSGGLYYNATNAIELGQMLQQAAWESTSVLFFDDFESGMLPVWQTNPVGTEAFGTESGWLTLVGDRVHGQILKAFVGSRSWRDLILSLNLRYDDWDRGDSRVALFFRVQDANNMMGFFIQPGGKAGFKVLRKGIWSDFLGTTGDIAQGNAFQIRIILEGTSCSAVVNDQLVATATDSSFASGYLGLQCCSVPYSRPLFDNFMVTPLE
jgi:hypothetical protein